MNAKLCKRLRKLARKRMNLSNGEVTGQTNWWRNNKTGSVVVAHNCLRHLYRQLKKAQRDVVPNPL